MKKAVIFDIYKTLIDIHTDEHDPWIFETLSRYLAYHSVAVSPSELQSAFFERVRQHLVNSPEMHPEVDIHEIFSSIMRSYGTGKPRRCAVVDVAMLFRSLSIRHFQAYNGVHDALRAVSRKFKTAVVSDAQWVFTEPEMAMLGLDRYFEFMVLSSRHGYKKPDTRLFALAMQKLRVKPSECVYIGDNPQKDLLGAKRSGMSFIFFRTECVSYDGFQPDGCFSDYSQLQGVLEGIS